MIAENEREIDEILQSYNVPVLDEEGNPIAPQPRSASAAAP